MIKSAFRPCVSDYSQAEIDEMAKSKDQPLMIYHRGDWIAYHLATEEDRIAWNAYARKAAEDFDADPSLDSYDSHHVFSGTTRDGTCNNWTPPMWFPEWLAARHGCKPAIIQTVSLPLKNGMAPTSWYVTYDGRPMGDTHQGEFVGLGWQRYLVWRDSSPPYKIEYVYPEPATTTDNQKFEPSVEQAKALHALRDLWDEDDLPSWEKVLPLVERLMQAPPAVDVH